MFFCLKTMLICYSVFNLLFCLKQAPLFSRTGVVSQQRFADVELNWKSH